MLDYLKYAISPVALGIAAFGLWLGGNASWIGLVVLLGLLVIDMFLGRDFSTRDTRFPWLYDAILIMQLGLGLGLILLYAWLVGAGRFETTGSAVGAFLSVALVQFVVAAPPLHELFHRENLVLRSLGRLGLVLIFDPWRESTHVITHHLHTARPDDPDYARRGDTVYGHLIRTFRRQFIDAYHLERQAWTKRGRKWWDVRNAWVYRVAQLVVFVLALYAAGGWRGAAASVGVCLLGPRTLLEIFNYCGHYGLIAARSGGFEKRHTWNHLSPLVRILALEITNHADHHDDSYKPFYELTPDRDGPQQPHFLLCVLLSFVPPLWFRTIKPLLQDWDRRYASPQEREIARCENLRAGWAELDA